MRKISDLEIVIGQLAVGGGCIVIKHNNQLIGIENALASHLSKSAFNACRIVMTQHQVGFEKYDGTGWRSENFFCKGL
jgi:hypothetical protein